MESIYVGDLVPSIASYKKVIENSENFKVAAVAIAAVKCPQHIVK